MEKIIEQPKVEASNQEVKIQELTEKFGKVYRHYGVAMWNDIADFVESLKLKYPDAQEHRFFHIISMFSGGEKVEALTKLDFPGVDSVEKFIDKMYEKYPVETKK